MRGIERGEQHWSAATPSLTGFYVAQDATSWQLTARTICLDEEAYERLRAEKREGESFSDAIRRLAGERSWREVTGSWSDADGLESAIAEGRERSRERRDRLAAEGSEDRSDTRQ